MDDLSPLGRCASRGRYAYLVGCGRERGRPSRLFYIRPWQILEPAAGWHGRLGRRPVPVTRDQQRARRPVAYPDRADHGSQRNTNRNQHGSAYGDPSRCSNPNGLDHACCLDTNAGGDPDVHPHRYANTDADLHPHRYANTDADFYADGGANTHSYVDTYANFHAHRGADQDRGAFANGYADTNVDAHANGYTHQDRNPNENHGPHADPDIRQNADADEDRDADPNTDRDEDWNADPNAALYPHAVSHIRAYRRCRPWHKAFPHSVPYCHVDTYSYRRSDCDVDPYTYGKQYDDPGAKCARRAGRFADRWCASVHSPRYRFYIPNRLRRHQQWAPGLCSCASRRRPDRARVV